MKFNFGIHLLFEVPIESEMMEITCEAQMVHYKKVEEGWEVGISFHDIKPSIQMILKKYIQSLEIK